MSTFRRQLERANPYGGEHVVLDMEGEHAVELLTPPMARRPAGEAPREHLVLDLAGGRDGEHEAPVVQMSDESEKFVEPRSPVREDTGPLVKKLADEMWEKLLRREPLRESIIARVVRPPAPNISDGAEYYDAFLPKIVSIGPLHNGDPRLEGMEPYKWVALASLLQVPRCGYRRVLSAGRLYELVWEIWNREKDVRRHYPPEGITPNPRDLVEMMVLDGCFILHVLKSDFLFRTTSTGNNLFVLLNDLLLLENQIPFIVLRMLSRVCGDASDFIVKKALELLAPYPVHDGAIVKIVGSEPKHLLHLMLLSYVEMAPDAVRLAMPRRQLRRGKRMVFSATELRAAGIKFRTTEKAASMLDVSFDYRTGELCIPPMAISRATVSLLRNLVALEQRLDDAPPLLITPFLLFMDSIIDSGDDVRLLGRCGVIKNYLASDKAAATFFNTLHEGIVEAKPGNGYYTNIQAEIDRYCSSPVHGWWVKLQDDYFGSPWTGISVVAAILALLLTAVQAYFSAFPRGS